MTDTPYDRAPTVARDDAQLEARLYRLWKTEPGWFGWLATVDHKQIGLRYIITAFAFLIAGGVEALIFRLQLSWSNMKLLDPEHYNQLFTMHGMTFSAASIIIAVPSAVGVFAWLATIWTGRPQFTTPFLFFASFIILFTIGGVSGYMTGSVPVDWQLTDTYFVVAHLHYVLIGINVFPVVGATYFWFPKMTGRMMDERLGKVNFWTMFIGFNLGFFPMHISGLLGMPRRIYTYSDSMGWGWLNLITTLGSFLFGIGVLMFVWNVVKSHRDGAPAGANPWDAPSLEWATSSPPPPYNFAVIPTVASRHPLWESRLGRTTAARSHTEAGLVLGHGREALGTTPLDAQPDVILKMPGDTVAPLLLSLSMTLVTIGLACVNWWGGRGWRHLRRGLPAGLAVATGRAGRNGGGSTWLTPFCSRTGFRLARWIRAPPAGGR